MKKTTAILSALILVVMITIAACNVRTNEYGESKTAGEEKKPEPEKQSPVKRGEYLVSIMGCDDCHTPKIMGPKGPEFDMGKRFSGHPANMPLPKVNMKELDSWVLFNHQTTTFVGPWGASFAANLTSDDSGIGTWSEDQFMTAIRKGKFKGFENSRDLLPPMPWPVYKNTTDEDLKAIFAYLKSTPPVENMVPAAITRERLIEIN